MLADKVKVMEENLAGIFFLITGKEIFPYLEYGLVCREYGEFKNDDKGIYTNQDNR
jgi:hypothetical protein